ncbi:MAG: cupin domain-containing protein [bacterium]
MSGPEELIGQVVGLAGLVEYQRGAVVSREVVQRPTGTVTVFAFDRGQELSEHAAPFDALAYIVEGTAEISLGGKPHRVRQGEMLIMPANAPHVVRAVDRFKMMLVMIRG